MRILHLFEWKLKDIKNNLHIIKEQGFDSVQITPIQPNKFNDSIPWWGYYQPIDFKIGNQTGTKDELVELCSKARELNINIIADVVLNHVASDDFGNIIPHYKVNKELVNRKDFWKVSERITDWNNREEVINKTMGLPTFDLSNHDLQDIIINFLNELIVCGVIGFRFDAAKQCKLPSEGSDFWIRVIDSIKDRIIMNYAEIIYSEKNLLEEYAKYINVLTDGHIDNTNKLVTFFESHDTYNEFGFTRNMTDEMRVDEYRVLCNRFKNTIFYARPYDKLWMSKDINKINKE